MNFAPAFRFCSLFRFGRLLGLWLPLAVATATIGRGQVTYSGVYSIEPPPFLGQPPEEIFLGGNPGAGSLAISNGGSVSCDVLFAGELAGGSGTVTVDGPGSILQGNQFGMELLVGAAGSGSLAVTNGGSVVANEGTIVGQQAGSNGTVTVDGPGSNFTGQFEFTVGVAGNGSLAVTNGGSVSLEELLLGQLAGGSGTVTVDGPGSTVTTGSLGVGSFVGNGSLTITNGGSVVSSSVTGIGVGTGIDVENSTGTVTVDGPGSTLTSTGVTEGYSGGTGTLNISNGGMVNLGGSGTVTLGADSISNGTLNIGGTTGGPAEAGGILDASTVTSSGIGIVQFNTISDSSNPYYFTSDNTASGGAIDITGTIQVVNNGGFNVLTGANTFTGGATINGGTLEIGGSGSLQNNSTINNYSNFIVASGASVNGGGTFTQAAGSTVVNGSFTQGTLNILGGSFTQNGSTTITGNVINNGAVAINANTFTAQGVFTNTGSIAIGPGAVLSVGDLVQNAGSTTLNGGTINGPVNIQAGTLAGSGTITGNASVQGATLAPSGTLTFTNGLSLSDGTTIDFHLGTNSDLIAVTGGVTGSNDPGGILLNIIATGGFGPGDYDLITGDSFSNFNIADFAMGSAPGGYLYNFTFDNNNLILDVSVPVAIPEPSLSAMLIGTAGLLMVVYRRRKFLVNS